MRSIVYISTQTHPLTDAELAQILVVGREKNTIAGVTGILAHRDENCLGILEGDDAAVRARFEEVRQHPSHTNVQLLCDDPIEDRAFPTWSMAFQPLDPLIRDVPGFVDLFAKGRPTEHEIGASRARALLEWFRTHPLAPLTSRVSDGSARNRAVNGAISVLREVGPERLTHEDVAYHAGMPVSEVRGLFTHPVDIAAAALTQWITAVATPILPLAAERGAVAYLHALIGAYAEEPGLDRLIVSALASAADPNAPAATRYREAYSDFVGNVRDALAADAATGREPATMNPDRGAKQLVALFDGLRIHALLVPGTDVVDEFDRAATRMRRGWSESYEQPAYWDISPVYDLDAP
ncbi:BLUF domain-containing protein [Curtobacterium sp. NPDC090217]|uniref:BLUF domain-containing protein n=1 Tax=Curtobacterium sp. NPDC090217 TaxID=3363970 RepID=UPI0038166B88